MEEKKSNGALMGSIIIILILVLGGVYLWMAKVDKVDDVEDTAQTEEIAAAEEDLVNLDAELDAMSEVDFTAEAEAVE